MIVGGTAVLCYCMGGRAKLLFCKKILGSLTFQDDTSSIGVAPYMNAIGGRGGSYMNAISTLFGHPVEQ